MPIIHPAYNSDRLKYTRKVRVYHNTFISYTIYNGRLDTSQEAYDELDALYEIDEEAAALFDVLLETLADDKDMLDQLFRPSNHFQYAPPFEIKRFAEMHKLGKNIFILKVRDVHGAVLPYRMLMGFHAQIDTYYILAVIHRDIDYDISHPAIRSVFDRYEQCGIPTYSH